MNEEQLAELERLERAATPGPWVSVVEGRDQMSGDSVIVTADDPRQDYPDVYVSIAVNGRLHPAAAADQDFIAAARNAVPALIAEVRRLRAASRDA
jgi:hypothetical protein